MDALRTRALSAIRLRKIGVKSILRLSLSTTPAADPGYWRILQTFDIFHRIVQKEPRLLNLWIFFIGNLREIFLVVFFLNFWWFPLKFLNFNLIWHHWKHCFGIIGYNMLLDKFSIGMRWKTYKVLTQCWLRLVIAHSQHWKLFLWVFCNQIYLYINIFFS
jgi:hypothetical protein